MIRRRVTDLALVVGLLAGASAALLAPGVPWPVEWAFGLPLLLLLPGYVVVAALFPAAPERPTTGPPDTPGWAVRAALSLVITVVVVALAGVFLASQGVLRLEPVLFVLTVATLVGVVLAAARRRSVSVERRADPFAGASPGAAGGFAASRVQALAFAVAVLVLLGSLTFAGGTPAPETQYSEVYLQGDAPAGNETRTLAAGAPNTVALGIENHEGEAASYWVVLRLQRVGADGTVLDQQRLDSFETELDADESGDYERTVSPSMRGDRLRLQTLVYKSAAGEDPRDGAADLSLRRWVTVVDRGAA